MTEREKINQELICLISDNKEELCSNIITDLDTSFPHIKYNRKKCIKDILIIMEALCEDIPYVTGVQTTNIALNYSKLCSNSYKYPQIYAIVCLKKQLLTYSKHNTNLTVLIKYRFKIIQELSSLKVIKEIKWWDLAARSLPMMALGIIIVSHAYSSDCIQGFVILVTCVGFLSMCVLWWWWAIWNIANVMISLQHIRNTFVEVKNNLSKIKIKDN